MYKQIFTQEATQQGGTGPASVLAATPSSAPAISLAAPSSALANSPSAKPIPSPTSMRTKRNANNKRT